MMQQITVESGLEQQLSQSAGQVVLCDERGRALGFFSLLLGRPSVEDLQLEPLLSTAETEQLRKRNRTGKPLEVIIGRLGL